MLVSLLLSSAGLAQPDPTTASALFKAGREAARQKDYAAACARFAESYRLDPAPGTGLNLADCEENLGHLASAWQRYRQVTEQLPPGDPRVPPARQRAAELEPRVPHITIKLSPSAPADTRVTRDGLELSRVSLGIPLPVDPGAHRVVAAATGRQERTFTVNCAEGQRQELIVEPGAPIAAASSASAPPPSASVMAPLPASAPPAAPEPPRPLLGYTLLGLGSAGLIVAGVTGAMVASRRSTAADHCPSNRCDAAGYDAATSGKSLLKVNAIAWAAGLAGVGAGLYFILSGPPDNPTARVGGAWLPGGGALVTQGSF
jgi:hypothetical protein